MQIVYFPYLAMGQKQEIDFGFLKIWNLDLMSKTYVTEPNLHSKLTKIMATNVAMRPYSARGTRFFAKAQNDICKGCFTQ
jgi:hypothetical protein